MLIGVGVGVPFLRGGLGAGVSNPPPVITGTPLLTDDEISISGTLPITFYGKNSATATPLTAAAIKAAPDDTIVLAGGVNYIPDITRETAGGTWYYNYVASNADGDSAVFTESYVVVASPEVTSFNSTNGSSSSFSVSIGATSAGDEILVAVANSGGTTRTPSIPNFDIVQTRDIPAFYRVDLLRWNGGGSRPNSSSVTVTLTGSANYTAAGFVISQATTGASTTAGTADGFSHTLSTVSTAGNAITVAVMGGGNTTFTPTGPGGAPPLAPTLPADRGYWEVDRAGVHKMLVLAYDTPSAGTTPAITLTSTFGGAQHVIASVEG